MDGKKNKIKGALNQYFRWPVIVAVVWIVLDVHAFFVDKRFAALISAYFAVYLIAVVVYYYCRRNRVLKDLVKFAGNYHCLQTKLLKELELPFGILDEKGRLLWGNDDFMEVIQDQAKAKKNISHVITGIDWNKIPDTEFDTQIHTTIQDKSYNVVLRRMRLRQEDLSLGRRGDDMAVFENNTNVIAIYLHDETELMHYIKENKEEKMIVGLLYIDNYEEVLESIDEVRRSLLIALVDRKVNKYMQNYDGIVKKLEKDKYILIFKAKYLGEMQANKFAVLEDVRSISIGNEIAVTLSVGIGVNRETYLGGYESARAAIDLALGRGGDQAVVRDGEKILYYGGKNVSVEKNTRVKARVKAHALRELIEAKEKVVVMGHAIGDVDSLGAAIGIYRIAKTLNKRAYIVINEITRSVKPVLDRFTNNPDYEEDMFINSAQAKELMTANTLLVIVDVNRPNYTECPDLLSMTNTIVVLDHHRRTGEAVKNAVLSYIEPYASSACEMVAEILQYTGEGIKLRQTEADAIYSGIMIDTDNFLTKTGVRTFEAAAYLRRNGADVTRIRKAFRSDMTEYRARAEAIRNTEIYLEHYAIGDCDHVGVESPTILGAQVANELLDITGIKASFVLTPFNNKIYISARSIDELNVQLVMEKLGGGGNPSVAGAQLKDCTLSEAKEKVKAVLDQMQQEGDL
ncbi:DHH family phosphoesterase [Anaerolentibacter hominis]|uniref:DHH family phosphoesterase n=1 Tax=Anaerolentibacter hominis TaxID=3079009 RepID=UPI0031B88D99